MVRRLACCSKRSSAQHLRGCKWIALQRRDSRTEQDGSAWLGRCAAKPGAQTSLQLGQARQAVHASLGHTRTPTLLRPGNGNVGLGSVQQKDVTWVAHSSALCTAVRLGNMRCLALRGSQLPKYRSCQSRGASRACWREVDKRWVPAWAWHCPVHFGPALQTHRLQA